MSMVSKKLLKYLRYLHKPIVFLFILFCLASCAKRHVSMPDFTDTNLDTLLIELSQISSIEATLEVEFDKGDVFMNGDMFLKADENNLIVRVYYLGFPVGEIVEHNGVIKNTMKISKSRGQMIANGLKRSLFWWKNPFIQKIDNEETYTLLSKGIEIIIDKKTLLPIRQTVTLENGESLDIMYSEPRQIEEGKRVGGLTDWYQSVVKLSYQNYRASSKVNRLTLHRGGNIR